MLVRRWSSSFPLQDGECKNQKSFKHSGKTEGSGASGEKEVRRGQQEKMGFEEVYGRAEAAIEH